MARKIALAEECIALISPSDDASIETSISETDTVGGFNAGGAAMTTVSRLSEGEGAEKALPVACKKMATVLLLRWYILGTS
jgi:hypothetical protein